MACVKNLDGIQNLLEDGPLYINKVCKQKLHCSLLIYLKVKLANDNYTDHGTGFYANFSSGYLILFFLF